MKKLILQTVFIYVFLMPNKSVNGQVSTPANTGTAADYVGWNAAQPFPLRVEHKGNNYIDFHISGVHKARVTTGNLLSGTLGSPGDGIRIMPKMNGCSIPSASTASLDMWTSCSNGTNIRWGLSGEISGANSQFQQLANYNGFWFNASGTGGNPRYLFNTAGSEQARIGLNRFWRIGDNPSNNDAVRRLEVFENSGDPQFRITANANSGNFADFRARPNGNLNILPSGGNTGLNMNANPSHTLEINGNVRVRNIPVATPNCLLVGTNQTGVNDNQVSRLDFTGNANQVLLGNGTWGNAAASLFANNGATIANILGQDYVQWGQVNSGNGSLNGGELLHDTEIPFNDFNVFFADPAVQSTGKNRMQLGSYNATAQINALSKFSAINTEFTNSAYRIGGFFSTTINFNTASVPLQFNPIYFGSISTGYNFGLVSIAADLGTTSNRLIGLTAGAYSTTSLVNIGVSGKAYGSPTDNYGLYGNAGSANSSSNYGIFATASGGAYNVAAYFNGDIDGIGTNNYASDVNLKQNINGISNASFILSQFIPVSFEFNGSVYPQMNFSSGTKFGLIAQDVETVLPEIVKNSVFPAQYDSLGTITHQEVNYKSLNYEAIIPFLIKGHQEQQSIIDSLTNVTAQQDSINNALYSMITSCCSNNSQNSMQQNNQQNNSLDITLTDNVPSIVLDQNVPNPFAEQTTITYTLTEGVKKAQMLFYNIEGKLIQAIDLSNASGKGQINVFANDLSTGVYTYTLVVDGAIMGTKRMVKE